MGMKMRNNVVLVSGLLVHDSGKTWFTYSLLRAASKLGLKVSVYKPVAGHNAWYHYRTVVRSLELRALVGNDVLTYHSILPLEPIEKMNPVDLLLAPPSILPYLPKEIEEYLSDLESQFRQVVVARISNCFTGEHRHMYVPENLERLPSLLRTAVKKLIIELNADPIDVHSLVTHIQSRDIEKLLESCLEDLEMNSDLVIVESFNDAIIPFFSLLKHLKLLIIVSPGHVLVYDSIDRIIDIVRVETSLHGVDGYRAFHIIKHLQPREVIDLEPMESIEMEQRSAGKILDMILREIKA